MVRISNLELIKLLKENSRLSFVELARHFKVSETAIRKRMKKLKEGGIIRKYTVDIDPKKIGLNVEALIGVDTEPDHYISVIEKLRNHSDVIGLSVSSGDHMIMIECWFENTMQLTRFVKELEAMEGVRKTCPAIITEKIK